MSSMRYFIKLLLAFSITLFIAGCSTPRLFVNNDLPVIGNDAKFIVLPTAIHGLSGSRTEKEAIFYHSFKMAFADKIINTPQLTSRLKANGFADVAWQMSHAMHRLVSEYDAFSYADGYQLELNNGDSKFRTLDNDVYYLNQWLKQEYQQSEVAEYIAIAHIDSMGVSRAGKLIKYRVIAGIYSTQRQALERVISYVTASPNHHATILHDLDNLGFLVYRELFNI